MQTVRPRSGPTKRRAPSGSKLFDTLVVFKNIFTKKVDFEKKNHQTAKKRAKVKEVKLTSAYKNKKKHGEINILL